MTRHSPIKNIEKDKVIIMTTETVTTWHRCDPFRDDDAGDIAGDIQAGPAHSLRWRRQLEDGEYETLTLSYFAAANDEAIHDLETATWAAWVETMIELSRHTDPDDVGGSETLADVRYESRVTHPSLAEALTAADRYTGDNENLDPQTLWWPL